MSPIARRHFLKASSIGAMSLATSSGYAQSNSSASPASSTDTPASEARVALATTANWNDGLAHPIPYQNPPGAGKERGIALGGGGVILIAWYAGYFNALKKNGVDLSNADVVVGTSAGSVFGSMLTAGHLWRIVDEMNFFNDFPKIFSELIPAVQFNASQQRAIAAEVSARDASPASLQAIGRAAMAARNPDGEAKYYKVLEKMMTTTKWPSPAMYTTANDCFTGERIVVSQSSGIPVNVACAASSSAPGQMGPTFLKDRLCMDGGICQTSTHSDVIAGVKRALVFSLGDGTPNELKQGLRLSSLPNTVNQEVQTLQANGTAARHIVVGVPPGVSKIENIMDPKWISAYLEFGQSRGAADTAMMKAFWS